MRNFKRFLALTLSLVMLCGMVTISAGATTAGDYTDAANRLAAVGILKGDQSGNLMLDNEVKRWHTALFFMQIMTGITDASSLNAVKESTIFSDVPEYGTAIDQAYGFGVVRGRGNGIYGYNDNIIYQDMLVMAVRALGYETEEMNYPYGHILAAEKLGLTNNIATDVQYTDALTRGETAQIMWNTLTTEIAYVDPVSDKVIYPGEQIPTASIFDKTITRETYLERSKFSQGTLNAVITDYREGKLSKDPDIAVVDYYFYEDDTIINRTNVELNAEDLGITPYTNKSSFLGLPVTLYTDCAEADFSSDYNVDAEASEAKIVLAEFTEFATVQNIGDDGNIKYYPEANGKADYFVIDGKKYASDEYNIDIRIFDKDGWEPDDKDLMKAGFEYDSKKGYIGINSYGEINYTVITEEALGDTTKTLLILYTPYSFGVFGLRNLIYQPVSTAIDLFTIGTYETGADKYKNLDGSYTKFVEYTLGDGGVEINNDSTSVSKSEGEASLNAIITGKDVSSGDFIFYSYNETDGILNIGFNCGPMKSSRLTAFGGSKETVKIGGTSYTYGFPGAFFSDIPSFDLVNFENDYIDALEAGKDNVTYVMVENNIVYVAPPKEDISVNNPYLIISLDHQRMADLLGISVSAYERKITRISVDGEDYDLYVEDGLVKVAVLDTMMGEWYLSAITDIDTGDYDIEEDEFASRENLASHVAGYTSFNDYTKAEAFEEVLPVLKEGLVMLRDASNDGYVISSVVDEAMDYWTNDTGLAFSDLNGQTNKIKATNDSKVSTARATLKASSVIVIVDAEGNVGVRKGIQSTENNAFAWGRVYSASSDLIVMQLTEKTGSEDSYHYNGCYVYKNSSDKPSEDNEAAGKSDGIDPITVSDWEKVSSVSADETYYIATGDLSVTLEKNDDDTYTVTLENLFDLKSFMKAASVETIVETESEATALENIAPGAKLYRNSKGEITVSSDALDKVLAMAADLSSTTDEEFHRASITAFDDEVSIASSLKEKDSEDEVVKTTTVKAVGSVDILMATINLSSADEEDYDFGHMALNKDDTNAPNEYLKGVSSVKYDADTSYYLYTVGNVDDTSSVTDPTSGKLNNYILSTIGDRLYVPSVEDDYFENAVEVEIELHACGQFNESDGTLTIYMLKLIKDYTAE